MGSEDMRRQAPNVERMRLLGAEVRPVEFGTRTLKEATSEAIRDWIANVETTYYLIGSCVGPAPYPEIVRELQRVIGREAREQMLAVEGRLPEAVIACVGGGSNAIGMFYDFVPDEDVRLIGVEAAGAASLGTGRPGVLHGARSSLLADEDGQIMDAHSISAGLDYPGVGPEHAFLRDSGRAEYVAVHRRRSARGVPPPLRTEGIVPALESSHALARALDCGAELVARLPVGPRRQGPRRGARAMKTLVVYLMAMPETPELAQAAVEAGADVIELGFPFSDPLADGPVIRRAGERSLAAGMRTGRCLEVLAETRARVDVPLIPMTYASIFDAYGWERLETDARAAGATSFIVPDLPADVRPELRRVQLVAPTSTDERLRSRRTRPTAGCTSSPSPARPARAPSSRPRSRRSPRGRAPSGAAAARGLRHLDAGAGARGCRARRRHRRRLTRGRGRRAGAGRARAVRRLAARRTRRVTRASVVAAAATAAGLRALAVYIGAGAGRRMSSATVVGAGVFGAATARELALRGWDVTLVEQYTPGNGALGLGRRHAPLARRARRCRVVHAARRRARTNWLELQEETGTRIWEPVGARVVRATARTASSRRAARSLDGRRRAVRVARARDARDLYPSLEDRRPRGRAATSPRPACCTRGARRSCSSRTASGRRAARERRAARRRTIRAATSSSGPAAPWLASLFPGLVD